MAVTLLQRFEYYYYYFYRSINITWLFDSILFVKIVAVLDVDGVADKYSRKSIVHNYNVFLVAEIKVQHD